MTPAQAQGRIDAQTTRAERLAVADHVVVNDATRQRLQDAVDLLWTQLSRRLEGGG
jgi:dephospho-CoA kinase